MDILLEYLPLVIAVILIAFVCSILASRTRFSLVLTLIQGAAVLFGFCFLIWVGASLEELLLMLASVLLPSLLFADKRGRDKE